MKIPLKKSSLGVRCSCPVRCLLLFLAARFSRSKSVSLLLGPPWRISRVRSAKIWSRWIVLPPESKMRTECR